MLLLSLFLACTPETPEVETITITETEIVTETETETIVETEEICASIQGHTPCDFESIDSDGNVVLFSELVGSPVILDLSTMWCGPCNTAAGEIQEIQDAYPELSYVTILIENRSGEPPTAADVQLWEETHSITSAPVWGNSRDIVTSDPTETQGEFYLGGWPTFYFLDEDLKIVGYQRGFDSAVIEGWAEELIK